MSPIVNAQNISLADHNWSVTDITSRGLTKNTLFSAMDRNYIKLGSSICSNRALMWAYDFKRKYNLDTAKVFLFFTKETGDRGMKTWWYHVAPVINEAGYPWVLDAGFPSLINGPLSLSEWFQKFAYTTQCKEIRVNETDLVEHILTAQTFPQYTRYGSNTCYYLIAPGGHWTPQIVANHLLGRVSQVRNNINVNEVYQACIEATTSRLGRIFDGGKKKCKRFLQQY